MATSMSAPMPAPNNPMTETTIPTVAPLESAPMPESPVIEAPVVESPAPTPTDQLPTNPVQQ